MKKFALLVTPFLCMSPMVLHADFPGTISKGDFDSSQLLGANTGWQPMLSVSQAKEDPQEVRAITPEAEPKITHWADPFLTADFIYWAADQDGLEYATTGISPRRGTNASKGRVSAPDSDFQPGFKLGFGLRFKHDGWDLYANYTWLHPLKEDSAVKSDDDSDVIAMRQISEGLTMTGFHTTQGEAHWNLQFNALDLELGRNFYISSRLTLRPQIGFKFGWIGQDYHVKYEETLDILAAIYSTKMDQDFFGVGIRTGLDTAWYFSRHFAIYGDFAFSVLRSYFEVNRKDHYTENSVPKYVAVHNSDKFNTLTEVLELGIGLRYETTFSSGDYGFSIQAGWEEQIWFNQNQLQDLSSNVSGNLNFQGLTIKTAFMF